MSSPLYLNALARVSQHTVAFLSCRRTSNITLLLYQPTFALLRFPRILFETCAWVKHRAHKTRTEQHAAQRRCSHRANRDIFFPQSSKNEGCGASIKSDSGHPAGLSCFWLQVSFCYHAKSKQLFRVPIVQGIADYFHFCSLCAEWKTKARLYYMSAFRLVSLRCVWLYSAWYDAWTRNKFPTSKRNAHSLVYNRLT